jgi:hypothetical protein
VDRDNAAILGTAYHARDIADKEHVCRWNGDMYGVDMSRPGAQEYYDSVFAQLAAWDLDFVKVDDLSGHNAEIEAIRKAIDKTGRPIVFSISPGGGSNATVASNANLWRISGDFWDNWAALYAQFARINNVSPFRGPGHWPDADMIPFGNIRTWKKDDHWTKFTPDEHYTLMTLWSISRSPLILGANLPKNDDFTLSLLTNDEVIAVDQKSANNRQVFNRNNQIAWVADVPGSPDKYVALFNASPAPVGGGRGGRGPRPGGPPAAAGVPAADASGANIALAGDQGTGAGGIAPASGTPIAATAPAAPGSRSAIHGACDHRRDAGGDRLGRAGCRARSLDPQGSRHRDRHHFRRGELTRRRALSRHSGKIRSTSLRIFAGRVGRGVPPSRGPTAITITFLTRSREAREVRRVVRSKILREFRGFA